MSLLGEILGRLCELWHYLHSCFGLERQVWYSETWVQLKNRLERKGGMSLELAEDYGWD